MTYKPNPGCDIPPPKDFPDVNKYLSELPGQILKILIPETGNTAVANKLKETEQTIKDIIEKQTAAVKRKEKQLEQYTKIVCPLPPVLDKKAT